MEDTAILEAPATNEQNSAPQQKPQVAEQSAATPAPKTGGNSIMKLMGNRPKPTPAKVVAPSVAPPASSPAETPTQATTPTPSTTPDDKPVSKEDLRSTAKITAEMWTGTLNMALGKICGVISGEEDGSRFQLTEKEQKEYNKVATAYFMEAGAILSPKQLFILATGAMFGGAIFGAIQAKKDNANKQTAIRKLKTTTQRRSAAVSRARGEQVNELLATATEADADPVEVMQQANQEREELRSEIGVIRNRFEVDKDGLYTQHEKTGRPVKKALRVPPKAAERDLVLQYAKDVRHNGMTWGDANKAIRLALYGQEEPIKNQ